MQIESEQKHSSPVGTCHPCTVILCKGWLAIQLPCVDRHGVCCLQGIPSPSTGELRDLNERVRPVRQGATVQESGVVLFRLFFPSVRFVFQPRIELHQHEHLQKEVEKMKQFYQINVYCVKPILKLRSHIGFIVSSRIL